VPIPHYVYFDITLTYEFESVAPDESMTSCRAEYISITFKVEINNLSNRNTCGL
jgi:hypothetical protein